MATKTKKSTRNPARKQAGAARVSDLRLVTVRDAARTLGVHEDTVRRLIQRKQLRAVKVGRAVRVEEAELAAYVRRQRGEPEPLRNEPMTPGQRACLHARADILDRRRRVARGAAKADALAAAGTEFGREFTSTTQLRIDEASWVLDWLRDELERLDADDAAAAD